jgi:2-keto-4-pentenoate hydratase/2-oxohepta-3-ene-1,7-dioic acid hydratase in catechol pathway
MRFTKVQRAEGPAYGILEDDRIELISGLPWIEGWSRTGVAVDLADAVLLAPVAPAKIVAIGRNYAAHVAEMSFDPAAEPSVFLKPSSSLLDPDGTVVLPPLSMSDHVEHEAELVVVIGREARDISEEEALSYVLGFTCGDDVSARDLQRSDPHITRAKGFDTFAPVGPWIETELDLASARVIGRVNGQVRQDQPVSDMLFDVPRILASVSRWTTLFPGDVVFTGSPGGSGRLEPGDQVEIEILGLGTLRHSVAAAQV